MNAQPLCALEADRVVDLELAMIKRIRSAAETLSRSPNVDRRFLNAGERCSWPQYVRDWHAYAADKARMPRAHPHPEAIDDMDETIGWIAWLAARDENEARVVWAKAGLNAKTGTVASELRVSKQTVRRWYRSGIKRLVERFSS